jgi:hypothetical protein
MATIVVCLGGILGACGHLSRSDASSQIQEKTEAVREYPYVGTVSRNCKDLQLEAFMHDLNTDPIEHDKIYRLLSDTGHITIAPVKDHVWTVQLTDLGKKVAGEQFSHLQGTDCDAWVVPIDMATVDSVDIMGIVEDGVNAKIESAVWYVLTPVALAIRERDPTFSPNWKDGDRYLELRKFDFVKYDDGWRAK